MKEWLYAVDELQKRVTEKLTGLKKRETPLVLRHLGQRLSNYPPQTAPGFVACLSEAIDNLSQWRAYSGGEGGYMIRFDGLGLVNSGMKNKIMLLKVDYNPETMSDFLTRVVSWSASYYEGLRSRPAGRSAEQWAEVLVKYLLWHIDAFLAWHKHKAFVAEKEWRLFTYYSSDDRTHLRFRQRHSLMSRHLELGLEGLPITGVLIGPCRFPSLSEIAVSDLLKANGHDDAVVGISKVPYRTT